MNLTKEQPPAKYMLEMDYEELRSLTEALESLPRGRQLAFLRLRDLLREHA